jgi:hypothetical protein
MGKSALAMHGAATIPHSPIAMGKSERDRCLEGLDELIGGFAALITALFFVAWSGFDLVILLVGAAPMLFGKRFFSQMPSRSWRLLAQVSFVAVLAILAAVRLAALRSGGLGSTATSDVERWFPLLLSSLIPLWFVISGLLNRLPRHLLAGFICAAGAAAGPLLGFAWRDSLALAAAVLGVVLLVDGGIMRSRFCLTA